jgi:hypothetical protein
VKNLSTKFIIGIIAIILLLSIGVYVLYKDLYKTMKIHTVVSSILPLENGYLYKFTSNFTCLSKEKTVGPLIIVDVTYWNINGEYPTCIVKETEWR